MASSELEVEFDWTPQFARRAYLAYAWRRHAGWMIGSILAGAACVLALAEKQARPVACLFLGALLLSWWSWFWAYRAAGRAAARYSRAAVRLVVSDDGLSLSSTDFTSQVAWSAIDRLYPLRQAWVFVRSRHSTAVPAAALDPAMRQAIEKHVREAGGKIL
jgi:hypothetical protein